ncbi:MAG: nicotinate phosphoribosyltransferase [Acidobacteriota bacterium]
METRNVATGLERELAERLLGRPRASFLTTDAYKLSMAQAGHPLREETFYLSFRKGGPHHVPFDLTAVLEHLRPAEPTNDELRFMAEHGYGPTPAMTAALAGSLRVDAAPAGSWVLPGEPLATLTGPSFLVSWLEPLAVALHYPIQVATACLRGRSTFAATCPDEAALIELAAASVGKQVDVELRTDDYRRQVGAAATRLLDAVDGDANRLFEVGLRGASCVEQHLLALEACRESGLLATSNVLGAAAHDLRPVGTAGHEHQQRFGDDAEGFRALRDRRPEPPSYLLDTYDVFTRGLPAAVEVLAEDPNRAASLRFDSGDQEDQLAKALSLLGPKLAPLFVFEDGYDVDRTKTMEATAERLGVSRERRLYGYGSELVARPTSTDLMRDRVGAVYKLCQTGSRPVMKFSDTGKESAPGQPLALRRVGGDDDRPLGLIAQADEPVPDGYRPLAELIDSSEPTDERAAPSPATRELIDDLRNRRLG